MSADIRTTCPYCGVGCGVIARADGKGGFAIKGDPDHPANLGRLCVKGAALGETLGLAGRLNSPMIDGKPASWDDALARVAAKFSQTIADHGPDAVALYVSGQLLTEDYYVANKLMKGFIGSANIDTNSRLCMASSVAGHRRAFGSDTVPGQYQDLELADLVVLVGSNLAWCHPVLHQRLMAAKSLRPQMKIVVIDPRRTATCEGADLHLALAAGADAHLFNLLLCYLFENGKLSADFAPHISGIDAALTAARASTPADTGLPPGDLQAFLQLWAACDKVVTVYSQGINQSDTGTDKVNAIINCHLATGRIGRAGMGPFSITGQPNAMGGREVGGLANMLACHLDIENPSHRAAVQGFWASPRIADKPGLKAVDMFRAVETGQIKALWIMHTNPAVTLPDADRVARAIAACDFVAVSDIWPNTDTARLGHVVLPAAAWGEKDGTVTNSERMMSRQRAFAPPPALARPDWWQLAQVAQKMGFSGFDWATPADIFAEYAALSGVAGDLGSDFDISDMAGADYATLPPTVWPQSRRQQGGRFFGEGRFHTADGRARLVPVAAKSAELGDKTYPFLLNTGRVRDHWHTMTRTALSPRLGLHMGEPYLELHPSDAAALGLTQAELAMVRSPSGTAILRVMISDTVAQGHPFAPMHWTGQTAPTGRIDALVAAVVDPISGQPASKSSPVSIAPYRPVWYGYAISAADITPPCRYWAKAAIAGGFQYELAGSDRPDDWGAWATAAFGAAPTAVLSDRSRGIYRAAIMANGALQAALFIAPQPILLARQHVLGQLGTDGGAILAGRPSAAQPDAGPTVCACMNVGVNTIISAIKARAQVSVDDIGQTLGAGSNCGSCRPEIAALIARHGCKIAAE